MKKINNYITEKLTINNDKASLEDPFRNYNYTDNADLLEFIIESVKEENNNKEPAIWDDTGKYDAYDDFENFETSDGTFIDWFDEFESKVRNSAVAIWDYKNDKDKIKSSIIDFIKENGKVEQLYKKRSYYVDYWEEYRKFNNKSIWIGILEATISEDFEKITAVIIS